MAEKFDHILVVDADGHVNEGDVDLKPYLPEQWRSQAPVRLRDNRGHSRMLLEGRIWPTAEGPRPRRLRADDREGAEDQARHDRSRSAPQGHGS